MIRRLASAVLLLAGTAVAVALAAALVAFNVAVVAAGTLSGGAAALVLWVFG